MTNAKYIKIWSLFGFFSLVCLVSCTHPNEPKSDIETEEAIIYDTIIRTEQDLIDFRNKVNSGDSTAQTGNTLLANNITLTEKNWTPIGNIDTMPYQGFFDGNNKTISGLHLDDTTRNNFGLFGYIYKIDNENTGVRNLILRDANINGNDYIGSLAARVRPGVKITNVHVVNAFIYGNDVVGGLVAYLQGGEINNCLSISYTKGSSKVGGLVGEAGLKENSDYWWKASISNSISRGIVDGINVTARSYTGGIVGYAEFATTITNCTNSSEVYSYGGSVGGILGYGESIKIINCINYGSIAGSHENVAGIAGYLLADHDVACSVTNSRNTGTVVGDYNRVGGILGTAGGKIGDVYLEKVINTGNVTATAVALVGPLPGYYVGGIAGYNAAEIRNAKNTAVITTIEKSNIVEIGQIVGFNTSASDSNLIAPLIQEGKIVREKNN